MENLERYINIFKAVFKVNENDLNEDFTASSIVKWDSITHLSLITAIEDEFDIMLDTDDLLAFKSFKIGKQILIKYDIIL